MATDFDAIARTLIEAVDPSRHIEATQNWWPGDTAFEKMVGAVLCQHANWQRARIAVEALRANGLLHPYSVANASIVDVERCAQPAGGFRRKAVTLQLLAHFVIKYPPEAPDPATNDLPLRHKLLQLHGIGPETADSILLFGYQLPAPNVEIYLRRFATRLTGISLTHREDSDRLRTALLALHLTVQQYQSLYATVIEHGKSTCLVREPKCSQCHLRAICVTGKLLTENKPPS